MLGYYHKLGDFHLRMWSGNSSVSLVIRLRSRRCGVHIPAWTREFCNLYRLWGPLSVLVKWYRGYFPEIKRPGREVEHVNLTGAKAKNEGSCTSTLPICRHDVDSGKSKFYWFRMRHIQIKSTHTRRRRSLLLSQQDPVRNFPHVFHDTGVE
jgi:hypothetical protein